MDPKLEVEGLKELRKGLRAAGGPALARQLAKVGKRVTNRVVDRAVPDIPVDTGLLKSTARGTADAVMLGTARTEDYPEIIYWRSQNKWYHRELDKLESGGQLKRWYEEGLEEMLKAAGLDVSE